MSFISELVKSSRLKGKKRGSDNIEGWAGVPVKHTVSPDDKYFIELKMFY